MLSWFLVRSGLLLSWFEVFGFLSDFRFLVRETWNCGNLCLRVFLETSGVYNYHCSIIRVCLKDYWNLYIIVFRGNYRLGLNFRVWLLYFEAELWTIREWLFRGSIGSRMIDWRLWLFTSSFDWIEFDIHFDTLIGKYVVSVRSLRSVLLFLFSAWDFQPTKKLQNVTKIALSHWPPEQSLLDCSQLGLEI